MFRINPTDLFSFENPSYLPEIAALPNQQSSLISENSVNNSNLSERVELIKPMPFDVSDPDFSIFTIDGHIRAKVRSESFRVEKAGHWQEKLGTAKQWTWIQGGVAALIALGAAGAAAAEIHPYMVVAIGVCSVVCMVFCGMNLGRAFEASRQIEGWNANPAEKIAHERYRAYKEGFPYVFKNDLKLPPNTTSNHQILLPFEVLSLFEKYFDKFCTDLLAKKPTSDGAKKDWLDRFTKYNPVAKAVLEFAYGNLQSYEKVSSDYEVLHKHLTEIRNGYAKLRQNARQETQKVKNNINNSRNLALTPLELARQYYSEQADIDRQKNLKETTDPKKILEIKNEYSTKLLKYWMFYQAAAAPINYLFDQQINEAENNLQSVLNKIKENEASSHAEHFDYAWELLEGAQGLKDKNHFSYNSPTFFSEEIVFDIPEISPAGVDDVEKAKKQKPKDFDDSQYREYLEFVAYKKQ